MIREENQNAYALIPKGFAEGEFQVLYLEGKKPPGIAGGSKRKKPKDESF